MNKMFQLHCDIATRFSELWEDAMAEFREGRCEPDEYLAGTKHDDRTGLTLIARPTAETLERIAPLHEELQRRFSLHYVIPLHDLHLTVLSLEPIRSGFRMIPSEIKNICESLDTSISGFDRFRVDYCGLCTDRHAAFIAGFPADESLNQFRDKLKRRCSQRSVAPLVDRRYVLRAAHSTVLRFVKPSISKAQTEWLQRMRCFPLGVHEFHKLELNLSDYYIRKDSITTLWSCDLTTSTKGTL